VDSPASWRRYLRVVGMHKWKMLSIVALGTAVGVAVTRIIDPLYVVQGTVWVASPPSERGPIRQDNVLEAGSWTQLMTTYAVTDSVVVRERLYLTLATPADSAIFRWFSLGPTYRPGTYTLSFSSDGRKYSIQGERGPSNARPGDDAGDVTGPIGEHLGFEWHLAPDVVRPGAKTKFSVVAPRDAANQLTKALKVSMNEERGNFLKVTLQDTDAGRATRTLNGLLDQFVAVAADLKAYKLKEQSRVLNDQLVTTKSEYLGAEQELESYKTKIITLPSENTPMAAGLQTTSPTVMTEFFSQKVEADRLRQDRLNIEKVLASGPDNITSNAFLLIPSAKSSQDLSRALTELEQEEVSLRALQTKYTDESRQVQDAKSRINTLRQNIIPSTAASLIRALKDREDDLSARVASASRELQEIPTRAINVQRLQQNAEAVRGIYEDVLRRFQEAKLAEKSAIPDLKILDRAAKPDYPTKNSAPQIVLGAIAVSIALAIGLAFLLDKIDRRVQHAEQVTNELGLTILGVIPQLVHGKDGAIESRSASQVIEGFRSIRLGITHAYGAAGPVIFTVTSPGPGDGKSFLCSNLASSFAEAGYSTVLIDGDIRRGELHRMFQTGRQPGLTDFLTRSATLDQALRPSVRPNLSLVPCGTRLFRGPELLGSVAMREFLAEMKSRFQVVIVDSPPLGAAIDPLALSAATGHMLLVLRSGASDRLIAEAKLKFVDRLPVRLLGAVLNDVRSGDPAYEYYAYEYGYEVDDDEPAQIEAESRGGRPGPLS
jgi:capsular exopolysaccharide synthesis family protein